MVLVTVFTDNAAIEKRMRPSKSASPTLQLHVVEKNFVLELGAITSTKPAVYSCQVVHARQCLRMLLAQHPLVQPQGLSMHLFRLLVLALTAQYKCQVVHAHQCVWMLLAQHPLPQP